MEVHATAWIVSIVVIVGIICMDFVLHVRRPHVPPFKESVTWVAIYVSAAILFGVGLGFVADWSIAAEFFAGYVTEESLSLDNLFVFLLIITAARVPQEAEQKVLLVGIALALVFRLIFILIGGAVIERFSAIFYLFGAFLLYTAIKTVVDAVKGHGDNPDDYKDTRLASLVRRVLPITQSFISDRVTVVENGKRYFTPLLLTMVSIGTIDILFAMDSIPAVFGLTKEPYLVFMANACALLGLRQIYFLIGGLIQRLYFLPHGLAIILGFIGFKLIFEALATNSLPFINGGQELHLWEPTIGVSLGVIFGTLIVVAIASRIKTVVWDPKHQADESDRSAA
ncbi:MAG: TerC/Alx family metal homeostasis membrane protein [Propionibacteriaceae bacterium]|nr:TerC/Alx family metal homeostasis membrane protein [Propionibacteriaceae bacterium]